MLGVKTDILSQQARSADGTSGVHHRRPDITTPRAVTATRDKEAEHITGVIVGKPTVAGNSGTVITSTLLRAFEATGLGDAEWIRLPAPRARCRLTGFSRTGLCELIESKAIRAIKVRKPGAQRGVVLINRASLLAYLAKLDAEQNGGVA